jgi:hypothetical protein
VAPQHGYGGHGRNMEDGGLAKCGDAVPAIKTLVHDGSLMMAVTCSTKRQSDATGQTHVKGCYVTDHHAASCNPNLITPATDLGDG